MTVKCINEFQKLAIVHQFEHQLATINEMAFGFAVSRRTIIRVLEEQGIDPGIKTRKVKPKTAPRPVVIPTKTPWYRRILNSMAQVGQGLGISL